MNNWPSYLPTSMTYEDFLEFGFEDNPESRSAFEEMFNLKSGVDHVPLKNFGFSPGPVELADRFDHGRLGPEGDKVFYDHPAQYSNKMSGPAGQTMLDRGGVGYEREGRNFLTATDRFYNRDNWNQSDVYPGFTGNSGYALDHSVSPHPSAFTPGLITPGPLDQTVLSAPEGFLNRNSLLASRNITGPTGAFGPADATALTADSVAGGSEAALEAAAEAAAESAATDAASSAWGGPQAFAVNTAANLIKTRDRKKQDTFLGDEGSASGYVKGALKGGATGASIGSMFGPKGTLIGGIVGAGAGLVGAGQGYFDSTSAPIMNISRIKRGGGGMRGGLLGGGSMYG